MLPTDRDRTRESYDRVADEYTRRIYDELAHKPLDRELLSRFAERVRPLASERLPVCDLGCGPGHVARHLAGMGLPVVGMDLSPGMVGQAERLNPGIRFQVADMRALDVADASWSGIVALYSIIHLQPDEVARVLAEMHRALHPGGSLLLAVHVGDEVRHLDEWWERPVDIDFRFFRPEKLEEGLRRAGFTGIEVIVRPPYPDVEAQTDRAYIFARSAS